MFLLKLFCKVQRHNKGLKISINILCATLAHILSSSPTGFVLDEMSRRSSVQSGLLFFFFGRVQVLWSMLVVQHGRLFPKCYACGFKLLSPSSQYSSVCISVSRDTVLWKANLSSSPLKMARLLASSCRKHTLKAEYAETCINRFSTLIFTSGLQPTITFTIAADCCHD